VSAVVHAGASVHPTAIVEDGARLGAGCVVHAHAIVRRHGDASSCITPSSAATRTWFGSPPSHARVGARVLREHVTTSRATRPGGGPGRRGLFPGRATSRDCQVGDSVVMANAVLLAGHVQVSARASSRRSFFHQFMRIVT
jgi:UDP-N-acetylglucosamine acyltransferase